MSLPDYTEADVERWLGAREVEKARGYLSAVRKISAQPKRLTAEVQGLADRPYRVTITFYAGRLGPATGVHARCTCPVGWNCKHTAAALLAALRAHEVPTVVSPAVVEWLEAFRTAVRADANANPPARRQVLVYLLEETGEGAPWEITFAKASLTAEGRLGLPTEEWNQVERALKRPPRFVDADDLAILRLLWLQTPHDAAWGYPLAGPHAAELVDRLTATGRLVYEGTTLSRGGERPGEVTWRRDERGRWHPAVVADPVASAVFPAGRLWYLDTDNAAIGPLHTAAPPDQLARLLTLPPLAAPDLPVVAAALADLAPQLPPPAPAALRVIGRPPTPVLSLETIPVHYIGRFRNYDYRDRLFDFGRPSFRYDEVEVTPGDKGEFFTTAEGETVRVRRRPTEEAKWLRGLPRHGLAKVPGRALYTTWRLPAPIYGLESADAWPAFMLEAVPALRAAGWEVQHAADFRHHLLPVEAWQAEVAEDEQGWLTLDMGIVVEGRRLSLPPLLHDLLRRDERWLDGAQVERFADDDRVVLHTPDGERVAVPAGRLKPLVRTLIDLFDAPAEGPLRLPRLDAPRLAELTDPARWQFKGSDDLLRLAERLQASRGITGVEPPEGFALQLRPYQREGLAWLQFLREQGLAGILADDMGLGKTAQTLAHLLTEKQAGRLDRPALVVLPTSLLFNWRREAARCAPALTLLALHGPERKAQFARIPAHDVVLTTYPLLWRDADELAAFDYHLLILDEAQTVKNAASKGAQAVRRLKARHRLCLTGTPLENHLGELWAQFDFLLPGFLGDSKGFTRTFRTPIEKHANALRRDLLARRVRPFILRRRKDEVAKELPPKNVIVRSVELEGGQRDLYETVRSAMDKKVRDAIAAQGFARSQIVILDALLKLRQVCCDPRLLTTAAAQRVKERAKLALLMDMVPELVDEGRRILLFSQFTTMLDLIAAELDARAIPYVTLTGQTRKREQVIDRFQRGETPVFLISLKAGGVGLNLTAADTVIHYDPWWNPAAENQATDRAHRIGQTRRVFVYKLVVAGSIEERILALQEKKGELAAGILAEDAAALTKFGEADIGALLAPLP